MSYVVLARKYRPQNFDTLVGQNPVSQTLGNAIESGRVAHAYVFSGPRGVGKTTTARILAKCLNCKKGTTINPCNECDSCMAISQGSSMQDVLEIDGASNRGIEQIRELRENAKYAPTSSRYRIFIIDEAHQITKDAFGALLKTLEEPPAHVVFMMATTEVQKIPAPILSRCQRFSLRPIQPELVLNHLKNICAQEKIKVEEAALADIVRFVEGSLRDALSLLDQAIVYAPEGITASTLRELLGLLPLETVRQFAQAIQSGDPTTILQKINANLKDGIDLTQLAKDLQAYYHSLLLAKAGVQDELNQNIKAQQQEATQFEFGTLERHIRLLSRALDQMRTSDAPRAIFEIIALQMGQKVLDAKTLLERLESIENAAPMPSIAPQSKPTPPTMAPLPTQASSFSKPSTFKSYSAETPKVAEQKPATMPAKEKSAITPSTYSPDQVTSKWKEFVETVTKQKLALGMAIEDSEMNFNSGRITLTFANSFNHQMVSRSLDGLNAFFLQVFGQVFPVDLKLNVTAAPKKPQEESTSSLNMPSPMSKVQDQLESMSTEEASADVQKALKHFPGVLKKVKPTA